MNLPQNYADVETARKATRSLYPEADDITMIEHSYDNIVALVDKRYAVRFPKNKNAYLRSLYDKHILKQLESTKTITIPRILGERPDPPCKITSFVPGHHISATDVRIFSQLQQQDFAKQVAQFAYTMHSAFSLDEELPLRKELGLDELPDFEPWPIYFKKTVYDYKFQTTLQDKLAKNHYDEWVRLCDVTPTIVVHDDLHTQNMMFEHNRLVGILDFGDTNIGTPEQELRQLYRINEEVMLAAVSEYQRLSGQELNIEALKLWAVMQELAVYAKTLVANKTSHHTFKRAARNLNEWLNKGEWGKGYDTSSSGLSQ
jgi:aminoglycoside phosphotransferase (APT) family kinase protein